MVVADKVSVLPHPPCQRGAVLISFCMSEICMSGTDISALYRDFTNALADVLAENAVGLASRGRLARTRAAVKNHPDYSEAGYLAAVDAAFNHWQAIQTGKQ
jgi:hypothetical protein